MVKKNFMIKNLIPGLVERGKIKIGIKGDWRESSGGKKFQLPTKLDHFVVTGALRDESNNFIKDEVIHEKLGPAPIELPIYLLYNEIELNFQTRYACYVGTRLFCSGDGENADYIKKDGTAEECACPCKRQDPKYAGSDKCKINGILSVIISGADIIGGVWKFRTTSYNSVVQILGSLTMIKRVSGGYLAGLPLWLTLRPKTVSSPVDGRVQTVYVVGIEFRGNIEALQAAGYKRALSDAKHNLKIEHIEEEAKRLISPAAASATETEAEIVDEFYPDAAQAAGPDHPAGAGSGAPPLAAPADENAGPPAGDSADPPKKDDPAHGGDGSKGNGNNAGSQDRPTPPAQAPAKAKRGRPSTKRPANQAEAPQGPAADSPEAPKDPAPPAGPAESAKSPGPAAGPAESAKSPAPPLASPAGAAPQATDKGNQKLSLF